MFRKILTMTSMMLVIASCGSDDQASLETVAAPRVRGVTENEIIIGSHADLSGPTAILGVAAINGVRMRFDEANDAGGIHGRKIRFIVEDAGYQIQFDSVGAVGIFGIERDRALPR